MPKACVHPQRQGGLREGIADQVASIGKAQGLAIADNEGIDTNAANFRTLAQNVKSSRADCMFFGGITQNKGVQVFTDVNAANQTMKLFGPDGVADVFVTKTSSKVAAQTYITNPTLDPKLYPPAAQDFFMSFKQKYGHDPYPYAIYGYEAMKVALQAIKNAGDKGNDRQAVIDAFFKIKDRDSVLGRYSIDKNGDKTLTDYGANRVKHGKLVFEGHPRPDERRLIKRRIKAAGTRVERAPACHRVGYSPHDHSVARCPHSRRCTAAGSRHAPAVTPSTIMSPTGATRDRGPS